jgi:hypothetical protein
MMKCLLTILFLLSMNWTVVGQESVEMQDERAQRAWREDVDFLIEKIMDIHPSPFYRFAQAEFHEVSEHLKDNIPFLTESQIIAELARVAAMLDGHTYLFMLQQRAGFHLYPIRLYHFDEGTYVVNTAPANRDLIGARLTAVNSVKAQTVFDTLAPYSSADNIYNLREWIPMLMVMPELLQALDLIDALDQPSYAIVDVTGQTRTINFSPITMDEYLSWNMGGMWEFIGLPQRSEPLYLSRKAENFWHTVLEDSQTLYVQYNHVFRSTMSGMNISSLGQLITDTSADGKMQRLVIDLRHNGGGDNTTYGPLLSAIRTSAFNQQRRLFVIIGRSTFSAGKDFALDVARNTEAIFVGEPTGGMPNNYGDSVIVRLPNSGLEVGIASSYVPKGRDEDVDPWLAPDIIVPVTAADYFAGRDAALEAVIQHED